MGTLPVRLSSFKTMLNIQSKEGAGAAICTVTLLSLCHKYGAVMDHSGNTGMEALATGRHQNSANSTSEVLIGAIWICQDRNICKYVAELFSLDLLY